MKSLTLLWTIAANDLAARCCTSTTRDIQTVTRRVESEGDSFLTITLPSFCKDFERSLANGMVSKEAFKNFKRSSKASGIPEFLGGFLSQIFNRNTGVLLDEPDIESIFAVRQLTLMYSKILLPCTSTRKEKAIEGYIECEKEVRTVDANLDPSFYEEFKKASLILWGAVLQEVDEDVYNCRIMPRHGPGATADRLKGNRKFDQFEWTERLERVFGFGDFIVPNPRYHLEYLPRVHFLEPGAERPVKVITVPKTLKTPRIIAIEPTCMQYVQQGISECLSKYIESPFIRMRKNRNLGYGVVGFTDQGPNQVLARIGSLKGELATLDLSEASDRVSNLLVQKMLESFPNLAAGVDACRSRTADVPGHGVIPLAKFASMGSALTFPIEAMVFSTICFMGIAAESNTSVSPELIKRFGPKVRVYGDDIIVPVRCVQAVVQYLETFGFKVNTNKSFWTGKFRESCGKEFYDGHDVSVAKVRREFPTQLQHVEEILSLVSLRNQFYMLAMWETAREIDSWLEEILHHFPLVADGSSALGRLSIVFDYENQRMHPTLHYPLVKGYAVRSTPPESILDGPGALVKCLLKRGEEPFADSKHLRRAGRPDAVNIKLGWYRPF